MEKSNEVFDVTKCPLCSKTHKYKLVVLRSSFLYGRSRIVAEKRIRRLFICPSTGGEFEGIVTLKDDPNNKIASVIVETLIKEDE